MKKITTILLLFLVSYTIAKDEYKLIKIDYPDGKCLDGTVPAIYFKAGTEKDKFLLYFEGGGWCGSADGDEQALEDCYNRSKTGLGSSS